MMRREQQASADDNNVNGEQMPFQQQPNEGQWHQRRAYVGQRQSGSQSIASSGDAWYDSAVSFSHRASPQICSMNVSSRNVHSDQFYDQLYVLSPDGGRTQYTSTLSSGINMPNVIPQGEVSFSQNHPLLSPLFTSPAANIGPRPQQLAARHVVSKELPIFSGDPSEWPLFISSYQHSNQTCGYSDSENLLRLQRSLRGCKGSSKQFTTSPVNSPAGLVFFTVTLW